MIDKVFELFKPLFDCSGDFIASGFELWANIGFVVLLKLFYGGKVLVKEVLGGSWLRFVLLYEGAF